MILKLLLAYHDLCQIELLLYHLFLHACLTHLPVVLFILSYSTSGARDTIFMNLASRNSRATGPKIRVPLGLLSTRIKTAAFSSNLIYEPSVRRAPVLVRTITEIGRAHV